MEICQTIKCTGCGACANSCPKKCISMLPSGAIGHIYPVVDNKLCIDCGLCKKVCPQNHEPALSGPLKTYASWSLNREEHEYSSSGGLASYFSRRVLDNGGIVYGCSSSLEAGKIRHIRCEQIDQLLELRGSKYVQSLIEECYLLSREDLNAGKKVLFIGTPCQISGLKAFLGKSYENLMTVDLVCHGVASQQLMLEHLTEFKISENTKITFRNEAGRRLKLVDDKETILEREHGKDLYYLGFMSGLYFRESCYQCPYATGKRAGDITIADFWGIDAKNLPEDKKYGISLLLVNTKKGESFLSLYSDGLFLEERLFTEACNGNRNLRAPSRKHNNSNRFVDLYSRKGFKRASKKCLKKEVCKYKLIHFSEKVPFLGWVLSKISKRK